MYSNTSFQLQALATTAMDGNTARAMSRDFASRRTRGLQRKTLGYQAFRVPGKAGRVVMLYTAPYYVCLQSDRARRAYRVAYALLALLVLGVSAGVLLWRTAYSGQLPAIVADAAALVASIIAGFYTLFPVFAPRRMTMFHLEMTRVRFPRAALADLIVQALALAVLAGLAIAGSVALTGLTAAHLALRGAAVVAAVVLFVLDRRRDVGEIANNEPIPDGYEPVG